MEKWYKESIIYYENTSPIIEAWYKDYIIYYLIKENIQLNLQLNLFDSSVILELSNFSIKKFISELVYSTGFLFKRILIPPIPELLYIADFLYEKRKKVLSEIAYSTEILKLSISKIIKEQLFSIVSLYKKLGKYLSSISNVLEILNVSRIKYIIESISSREIINRKVKKFISSTTNLIEKLNFSFTKKLVHNIINITESSRTSILKIIEDMVLTGDLLYKQAVKILVSSIKIIEKSRTSMLKFISELLFVYDFLHKKTGKYIYIVLTVLDESYIKIKKILVDSTSLLYRVIKGSVKRIIDLQLVIDIIIKKRIKYIKEVMVIVFGIFVSKSVLLYKLKARASEKKWKSIKRRIVK